jgi:hypothetical protein
VVTGNNEPTPLFGDMAGDQCDRHLDIDEVTARRTEHMIVAISPTIISTCLISKRQFLDQPMLREEVQRAVDRAIGNFRISAANPFEDLASREMPIGCFDLCQNHRPLRRLAVATVECRFLHLML